MTTATRRRPDQGHQTDPPPPRRLSPAEARSFDHTRLAALPEYHALRRAVADLLAAAERARVADDWTGAEWVRAFADMARTTYAADWCQRCDALAVDPTCWPHAAEVVDQWMTGSYRCPRGHRWTMGYTTDLTLLALIP